jgi:hypothetical protein
MSDVAAASTYRGTRGGHDEARLTTHWPSTKPAPVEVVTLATLPPGTIFRIVDDYESLKEAFADRIFDLGVALTEIDAVSGMTRGNMQKLLSDSDQKWAREFGWKSLNKALRGTGMMLAFIIDDDEKFAALKAQMQKRRWKQKQKRPHKLLPPQSPAA